MAVVDIATGKVEGRVERGVLSFKGIPYGRVAGRRFRPAGEVPPWPGIRLAHEYGPSSPQHSSGRPSPLAGALGRSAATRQSEECLVLNIWTPDLNANARRPVMVWLHGGGYSSGSGSSSISDGTNLARHHDVIVVSLNHRLGPLGFLYLQHIAGDAYRDAGNLGSLDIVRALEWVRENIAAFGGDPGNVTIFGNSGGAGKVTHLMCMPRARGLFHRAILQSGVAIRSMTTEYAAQLTDELIALCGIERDPLEALTTMPTDRLLEAHARLQTTKDGGMRRGCSPVIDGIHLTNHPEAIFISGEGSRVPVIIGTNRDELTFTTSIMQRLSTLTETQFHAEVSHLLGERADEVVRGYRTLMPDASLAERALRFQIDHKMRMPAVRAADALAAGGSAPVFMYRFDWERDEYAEYRASHTFELPMVFDNVASAPLTRGDAAAVRLAREMSAAWTSLARDGRPVLPRGPVWRPYEKHSRDTMLFGPHTTCVSDPERAQRLIWRDVPSLQLGFD